MNDPSQIRFRATLLDGFVGDLIQRSFPAENEFTANKSHFKTLTVGTITDGLDFGLDNAKRIVITNTFEFDMAERITITKALRLDIAERIVNAL